jgi:hypothetical protein
LSSLIDLKVDTVLVKRELALKEAESASFDTSVAGALVKGTKKLLSN